MSVSDAEVLTDLDILIAKENTINLTDDDITVGRLAKKTKWNVMRAKRVIVEWTEAGVLEYIGERREPARGQKVAAWRIVKRKVEKTDEK